MSIDKLRDNLTQLSASLGLLEGNKLMVKPYNIEATTKTEIEFKTNDSVKSRTLANMLLRIAHDVGYQNKQGAVVIRHEAHDGAPTQRMVNAVISNSTIDNITRRLRQFNDALAGAPQASQWQTGMEIAGEIAKIKDAKPYLIVELDRVNRVNSFAKVTLHANHIPNSLADSIYEHVGDRPHNGQDDQQPTSDLSLDMSDANTVRTTRRFVTQYARFGVQGAAASGVGSPSQA